MKQHKHTPLCGVVSIIENSNTVDGKLHQLHLGEELEE